ncbi:hypothetical protein ACHAQA_004960 [Verticillium albo-atrum]
MSAAPKTEVKDEMPEVTARRLKKRELDRKAQRMARERTKSRIAHLEELVGHLSHNDTNAEVSQLMDRLLQTTQERDKLVGVLASLGTTIRHHTDALTGPSEGSSSSAVTNMQAITDHERSVDVKPFQQTHGHNHGALTTSHGHRDEYLTSSLHLPPPPNGFGWGFDAPEMQHGAGNTAAMPSYLQDASQEFEDQPPNPAHLPRSDSEFSSGTSASGDGFLVPPPPQPCECATIIEPGPSHSHENNTWRNANQALGKSVKLSEVNIEAEDRASQDTPVRAVIEGWDSVERSGMMTDSWRKLRVLDDICFSQCGPVERLAVLKTMHLLISCHGDPSPERLATLPRWYRKRPGVRERFVFSQHRYCTNNFWKLFRSNLTILWQFGFNDCFMQNTTTGRYRLAPLFEERIRDIRSWTMNVDFLSQYPELCDDIPMYGTIPPKPSTPRAMSASNSARWSMTPRPGGQRIKQDEEAIDMAQQQQQQLQQHHQHRQQHDHPQHQQPPLSDDMAKSSALVVTSQAPAFADAEYMSQNPGVHVSMAENPGFTYEAGSMVPTTMAPTELTPAGQHVYSGGTWFYSTYCQHGYT